MTDLSIGLDGRTFKTSYEWTPTKKVSSTTNPDGMSITRAFFDHTSFIQNVNILDDKKSSLLSTAFSDFDNATLRPSVCTLGNGLVSTLTTAGNGALTSSILKKSSNVIHSQTWDLDSFSKIKKYSASNGTNSITNQFKYDAGGKSQGIINVSLNFSPCSLIGQLIARDGSLSDIKSSDKFTYDDSGNLSSQNSSIWKCDGWQLSSITDALGNPLSTFKYSVDGNLTQKLDGAGSVKASMAYDSDGRLTSVNKTSFVYDYQGRVLKATHTDGSITYYPNPEFDLKVKKSGDETSSSHIINSWRRGFVSIDKAKGTRQNPQVYYLQTDHLGSVVAVSDNNGTIVTTYEYDVYGHTKVKGHDLSRYKYGGKEEFEGLYYFGARFYDPEVRSIRVLLQLCLVDPLVDQLCRFVSLDNITVSLDGITPQSFNQYTYARNDPVNFIEVNGNVPWWHWCVYSVHIASCTYTNWRTSVQAGRRYSYRRWCCYSGINRWCSHSFGILGRFHHRRRDTWCWNVCTHLRPHSRGLQ